jgi:hypothetical protein
MRLIIKQNVLFKKVAFALESLFSSFVGMTKILVD